MLNVPVTITKSTSVPKSGVLTTALDGLRGTFVDSAITYLLFDSLSTVSENNNTETRAVGDWLTDYITAGAIFISSRYLTQNGSGVLSNSRVINGISIVANAGTGPTIPEDIITNMVFGQDGANVPTSFDLQNLAANYSFGTASASLLSNQTIYSATLDVPTTHFPNLANLILQYTQKIQPVEITVRTARTYQPIVFTNTVDYGTADYIYPENYWVNGKQVKTSSTFTGATYNHTIVGTSHTITPDDWQTTYQLWKGL
jgi:hypothetical protein